MQASKYQRRTHRLTRQRPARPEKNLPYEPQYVVDDKSAAVIYVAIVGWPDLLKLVTSRRLRRIFAANSG
jgi:hypothetical protein